MTKNWYGIVAKKSPLILLVGELDYPGFQIQESMLKDELTSQSGIANKIIATKYTIQ